MLWVYKFVSFHRWTLITRKLVERKSFLANPKHRYQVSQCEEHDRSAYNKKKWRLVWVPKFVSFPRWTLITRKTVKRKAFLANPKDQYRVSQWGENYCSAHDKKNWDYYDCPSLHHFIISWMNFDYKENGGKNSFSCKSKASISCITMRKTWLQCP